MDKKNATPRVPESFSDTGYFQDLIRPFLCIRCSDSIRLVRSPLCRVCGVPFTGGEGEDHTCGVCLTSSRKFDSARACGCYDNGLKHLIHAFKYRNIPQLAQPLGELLAWGFRKYFSDQGIDLVVPVPLHPRRMRSRGFNQAYLLAREISPGSQELEQNRDLPMIGPKTMVRIRATRPQTGLGRELRRKNIRNAFRVRRTEAVKGKSILLVDDVYTTGVTVNECARMLKKAGADRVAVLTLARVA